jgi:hypothetical protein
MKVYKVFANLKKYETQELHVCDMVFLNGVPTLVLEWKMYAGVETPSLSVPLDDQFLHKVSDAQLDYLYECPVAVPL